MHKIMIVAPIHAINSWEGYEYQGHMALYMALKNINDLLQRDGFISDMELQIEGEEDFSIRKGGKYISLHQVKYGKVDLKEQDKFSFVIGILQNDANYGYFHIINGKAIPKDFVEVTLGYIEKLFVELDKEVLTKDEIGEESADDYIIIDNINGNAKKASIYNVLNFVCDEKRDRESIQIALNNIKEELIYYKERLEREIEMHENANPREEKDSCYLNTYGIRFDSSRDVRTVCYEIISDILNKVHPEWTFIDKDYSKFVYNQVLITMKERITDFHIEKNKNGKCIMAYDELLNVIVNHYHVIFDSVGYQFFKVINSIKEMYEKYPERTWNDCKVDRCAKCADEDSCNLVNQINILNSKTDEEKEQIVRNLMLATPEPGKSNNLPDDNLINRLLLKMLDEIELLKLEKNNTIQAVKSNGEFYRLSLDNSAEVYELQERISKELKRTVDRSFIFEYDVLITDHLSQNGFLYNGSNVNVLEEAQLEELRNISSDSIDKIKKDCNKPKVIRLVNREQAKGELS